MKITSGESTRASQISPVTASTSAAPTSSPVSSGTGPAASLQVSPEAQVRAAAQAEAASYVPAVNAVPDREDKISDLKSSIAAGTYQVSGQDIADQILRRSQADSIAA
jgi:anti-sigma28 factor (negative regulator of flagellin synthesis)